MIITKEFEGEMAHIVRNCSTNRCRSSVHGHSFKVLVTLRANDLDNAGMIYDFGLMKGSIKQFIDSFDHCTVFWDKDNQEYIDFIKKHSERWISLPFNPSAEMLSLFFLSGIQSILDCTKMNNNESKIFLDKVQYYETRTGSATAEREDIVLMSSVFEMPFECSQSVTNDWSIELFNWYLDGRHQKKNPETEWFENPKVEQQVK